MLIQNFRTEIFYNKHQTDMDFGFGPAQAMLCPQHILAQVARALELSSHSPQVVSGVKLLAQRLEREQRGPTEAMAMLARYAYLGVHVCSYDKANESDEWVDSCDKTTLSPDQRLDVEKRAEAGSAVEFGAEAQQKVKLEVMEEVDDASVGAAPSTGELSPAPVSPPLKVSSPPPTVKKENDQRNVELMTAEQRAELMAAADLALANARAVLGETDRSRSDRRVRSAGNSLDPDATPNISLTGLAKWLSTHPGVLKEVRKMGQEIIGFTLAKWNSTHGKYVHSPPLVDIGDGAVCEFFSGCM